MFAATSVDLRHARQCSIRIYAVLTVCKLYLDRQVDLSSASHRLCDGNCNISVASQGQLFLQRVLPV